MKTFHDFGIETGGAQSGEIKTTCPQCSKHRKKQTAKILNVNVDQGVWHCWHCGWGGSLGRGVDRGGEMWEPKKIYRRPAPPKVDGLSEQWARWLETRGITTEVIERNGLYNETVWIPQLEQEADALVWPYVRNGEVVNAKYRALPKHFRMAPGCEQVLYGIDDVKPETLVWVEGEMDRLSVEVAGFVSCVSVPNGAPGAKTKNYSSKFDYLESAAELLAGVKLHVLAVDNDEPGKKLEEELCRRLGADKCFVVHWPEGCKDANETLIKHGPSGVNGCIMAASPFPVAGVFTVQDAADKVMAAYETGQRRGHSTGWKDVDALYTVRECEWTLVTGMPGSGKSEWLDALMINMAFNLGWRFAVCSPENQPLENHTIKLLEKIVGKPFDKGRNERMKPAEIADAMNWLQAYFSFILPDKISIDEILTRAKTLIKQKGINGLVIDPWNELEATKPAGTTDTEMISQSLSKLRRFARENYIHLWIVAHPTKLQRDIKTGVYPVPTPYDVSGSAHWRNKADNAITIYRSNKAVNGEVEIHVQKIRFKVVGQIGKTTLIYDRVTGRYRCEKERPTCNYIEEQEHKEGWQHQ